MSRSGFEIPIVGSEADQVTVRLHRAAKGTPRIMFGWLEAAAPRPVESAVTGGVDDQDDHSRRR